VGQVGFVPGNTYGGSITVNADCTGTITFTDSASGSRTDSIVVLNGVEIWGMSQDPAVLWTYRAKKIGLRGRATQA